MISVTKRQPISVVVHENGETIRLRLLHQKTPNDTAEFVGNFLVEIPPMSGGVLLVFAETVSVDGKYSLGIQTPLAVVSDIGERVWLCTLYARLEGDCVTKEWLLPLLVPNKRSAIVPPTSVNRSSGTDETNPDIVRNVIPC